MRVLAAVAVTVFVLGTAAPPAAADAWVWPVEGTVLTPYSNDNGRPYAGGMHRGIDIAAGVGTTVVAAQAGTVTHAGVVGSSGLTVAVRTADGRYTTSYLHLASVAVAKGDAIATGTKVGAVGTSGRRSVDAPHLHFGVRLAEAEDRYVDPLTLLPPAPGPGAPAPSPAPAPVPVRAAPAPVPVPVRALPHAAGGRAPARLPARLRPRGTLHPGPAVAAAPAVASAPAPERVAAPARPALRPDRVPAGPVTRPLRAPVPVGGAPHVRPAPAGAAHPGRPLLLGGLGLLALVLFGSVVWRGLARVNAGVNERGAEAVVAIRDRVRIPPHLRRILPR
jgi:hypothetical protein